MLYNKMFIINLNDNLRIYKDIVIFYNCLIFYNIFFTVLIF